MSRAPYPAFDGTQPCASEDPEKFFATVQGCGYLDRQELARLCASCSFQADCLAWALERPDVLGWWGGTTERDRRRMRGAQPGRPRKPRGDEHRARA